MIRVIYFVWVVVCMQVFGESVEERAQKILASLTQDEKFVVCGVLHGLSFTTFQVSNLQATFQPQNLSYPVSLSTDIQNTGAKPGVGVLAFYLIDPVDGSIPVTRPWSHFVATASKFLQPGEKATLQADVWSHDLAFYDADMEWYGVWPGTYRVEERASSASSTIRANTTLEITQSLQIL